MSKRVIPLLLVLLLLLVGCGEQTSVVEDDGGDSGLSEQTAEPVLTPDDTGRIAAGGAHTILLKDDGTVLAAGYNGPGDTIKVSSWEDIVAVYAGEDHTVGLRVDGTARATGGHGTSDRGQTDVDDWDNLVAISSGAGMHTVGLRADGTVVAVGDNADGQCDVDQWNDVKDIVAVSAGVRHTVALRADGTVMGIGYNGDGQLDISHWTDIKAVSAGALQTVGVKKDGTVVAAGGNKFGQIDVEDWQDVKTVVAAPFYTFGLKNDGTVVMTGYEGGGIYQQFDPAVWVDMVAIDVGPYHAVGYKGDGTVVGIGDNDYGELDLDRWEGINSIIAVTKDKAPDFTLKDTEGAQLSLSDFANKRVMVVFWDCGEEVYGGTVEQLTVIEELYQEMKDEDVVFLSVAGTQEEKLVKDFQAAKKYSFPILIDTDGIGYYRYGLHTTPNMVFVDSEGYIDDVVGQADLRTLRELIDKLE